MPDRSRRRQASNSTLIVSQMRDTVERDNDASGPRASSRAASMSRSDRPRTQPAITSDSSALVLVTCRPRSREQNGSSVPRTFGRSRCTAPAVVLIVTGLLPLRYPGWLLGPRA